MRDTRTVASLGRLGLGLSFPLAHSTKALFRHHVHHYVSVIIRSIRV